MKIEFFRHSIDKKDIAKVSSVLKSIFLTTGDVVSEFENNLSSYTGLKHSVGLTSCTAALQLSLIACGIKNGDEVITTPMSFCATSNAVIHVGAVPVFVDVERETGNINAELIEKAVTEKTRAILPVHLYGQMCDMRKIKEIADKYNLIIIEDAAHALEAERDKIRVGHFADSVCFSFYATKNITSGEGGAISTNNRDRTEALKMLRMHGIDKSAIDRYTKQYQHWDMPILGWKYNMDNIHAALLIGQLKRIDILWKKRNKIWKTYEKNFKEIEGIDLLKTVKNSRHAHHLFTILVDSGKRDSILWAFQKRNIGVAVNYRPIHLLKYYRDTFKYKEGDFPVAEEIGMRTISIPLYPGLKNNEVNQVIKSVKEVIIEH